MRLYWSWRKFSGHGPRQGLSGVARKGPAGCRVWLKRATLGATFGPYPARQAPRTTRESPAAAQSRGTLNLMIGNMEFPF